MIADYKGQLSNLMMRIERIPEDIIDIDVPRVMEETLEVVKLTPREKVQKTQSGQKRCRTCSTDNWEKIGEVIPHFPQERAFDRVVELIVDVHVPEIREQTVEVVKVIPRERVQADIRSVCPFYKSRSKMLK